MAAHEYKNNKILILKKFPIFGIMACAKLHLLPILVFLWFPLTFFITFFIAVLLDHVTPVFPYISDTSTFSPESCIFAQLINMGVVILSSALYIRYRQIRELYQIHDLPKKVQTMNIFAAISSGIAVFGVSIVGNFQETNVTTVHLSGAFFGFGLAVVYMILMTVISFKVFPMSGQHWILAARVILALICTITFILSFLFAVLAYHFFTGATVAEMTKWSKDDGGWELHIVSTASEWIYAICTMAYVFTFTPEFRHISLSEPVLHLEEIRLIGGDTASSIT